MKPHLLPIWLALTSVFLADAFACADVVIEWNAVALQAIRGDAALLPLPLPPTPPPKASRLLAILHAAIYDAINGIDRKHEAYLVPSAVPASASKLAAASAAGHSVLVSFYSTNAATYDALHATILAAISNGPQKNSGITWGKTVAAQILAARVGDGAGAVVPPPASSGPGDWVPTPPAFAPYLLPQWGALACFSMTEPAQFRPPGPPTLDSVQYAADFNEVRALGAKTGSTRTPDQDEIALFWADGAGTETPPGHWNHIAQEVAAAQGNTLEKNARLFALLNLAMADAAICAWDAKYHFNFWRPITAIHNALLDGNPDTELNPAWLPFITTPPFPEYISGHSTFSGAAATTLALFHGTDHVAFTTGSDFLPGVTRSFDSFSAAADEAAASRLYGGIHFRSANADGLEAGRSIGAWTVTHYLQPKGNRSRK